MNKELFVSSTPHETKVGLVEDDLLAEIYLERENEYTLAGSIYKGRVTRVLPGMQSAFVDIGLERDAFLYVSDFMELEEHDDDLTDAVPANRGVQDLRPQAVRADALPLTEGSETEGSFEADRLAETGDTSAAPESESAEEVHPAALADQDSANAGDQNRDRGSWRGRRRRGRGGRRDGRGDGRERGPDRGPDRTADRGMEARPEARPDFRSESRSESRYARPAENFRSSESTRSQPSGPPPGYTPILLPGESISKYSRFAQQPAAQQHPASEAAEQAVQEPAAELATPLADTFPEDEPIFAAGESQAEPLHEEHGDIAGSQGSTHEEVAESTSTVSGSTLSASTSAEWNQEFRKPEEILPALGWPGEARIALEEDEVSPEEQEEEQEEDKLVSVPQHTDQPPQSRHEDQSPVFAAPGTMEEETIDEEEAGAIHYEASSDEGYDEFEEETQAAGPGRDAHETVAEIHRSSINEAGLTEATGGSASAPGTPSGTEAAAEEDSEELELEEAQAEAEAMLDAEARGNGTVDARVEVRAPAGTASYTQRSQRPRPGYDRQGGPRDRGRRGGGGRRFRRRESAPVPLISDLLKEGQEILVQIAKEPIGKKGARITSHIALPGRFLVYMPTVNHTGVSRKIASEEERQRLKRIILSERENGHGGFIVRTAAQSASEEELRADIRFLKGLWQDIKNRAESSKPPALIYHDLNVVERVLRDQVTSDFSVIWVDTESEYERILRFFNRFQPGMVKRVKLYTKETPLFEQFGLTEEMNKALKSKVWLKSGGYIVINQTEALVAIDINTGKYVGKTQRLEDTIVKTNVDAIKEIVRQIRLRDLGGIIIIDFIDMDERRNRQRVMQALEEELRHDRAPSKTLQFNDFGLVAITRKRVKQSLERTIGAPCPYCEATGYVKSVTTVCNEIYVEMRKIAKHLEHEDVMLRVHPDVAKELKTNNGRLLNEMEEMTKRTIIVKSDPAVHQQQFDIN
ncbi:MAG TPA: Rne/Rng family ribonuclease [Terriglobales bacterium]|nr:Rne/Rng family ribonuclease [Terriglobales bacterium]